MKRFLTWKTDARRRSARGLFTAVLMVLAMYGKSYARVSTTVVIDQAKWQAASNRLTVSGHGALKNAKVVAIDLHSGVTIAKTSADSQGQWEILEVDPAPVPCTVKIVSYGGYDIQAVQDAPSGCSGGTVPAEFVTGVTISGADVIEEGKSTHYTATGLTREGGGVDITRKVVWTSSDPDIARIDTTGEMTAYAVSEERTVQVRARYEASNAVHEATKNVTILDAAVNATGSHTGRFDRFEGTKTCLSCHVQQADQVHQSVHYQWKGDASQSVGLTGPTAGKLGGINDFCIYPDINWIGKLTNVAGQPVDAGCAKCHAGLGEKPSPVVSQAQRENIDCLVCHSSRYQRKVEWVVDRYRFVPDSDAMTVSVLEAATDITLPSKETCLNCHTHAGGGNNLKRGDIEAAHRNPSKDFDVHMASKTDGGAGLSCLDYHTARDHKIAGRGSDLRSVDLPEDVDCTKCHPRAPHNQARLDKHTGRVDCTVCHIPYYAKAAPTDMNRDWSAPGDLVATTGLYEPHHEKASNVAPEYRFFNGTSYFYQFGEPAAAGPGGRVVMSEPVGSVTDENAKIHAFKRHTASQPIETGTRRLLPLKIGKFFETGAIDEAVRVGAEAVGWGYNGHAFAQTERWMGIFHEVAPKQRALGCNSCHNGGTRLNFEALGYGRRVQRDDRPLCGSCHEDKSGEWAASERFAKVHAKHVDDKRIDCGQCHYFTAAAGGG